MRRKGRGGERREVGARAPGVEGGGGWRRAAVSARGWWRWGLFPRATSWLGRGCGRLRVGGVAAGRLRGARRGAVDRAGRAPEGTAPRPASRRRLQWRCVSPQETYVLAVGGGSGGLAVRSSFFGWSAAGWRRMLRRAVVVAFTVGSGLVLAKVAAGLVGVVGFPCLAPCAGSPRRDTSPRTLAQCTP